MKRIAFCVLAYGVAPVAGLVDLALITYLAARFGRLWVVARFAGETTHVKYYQHGHKKNHPYCILDWAVNNLAEAAPQA